MSYQVYLPKIMEVGGGASKKITEVLRKLGCQRPLIITDKVMLELGYVAAIGEELNFADIPFDVFADTVPEPTVASIVAGVHQFHTDRYDSIIALGGGSPIDSAKAIGILGSYGGEIRDYKFPCSVDEKKIPVIAIPTTAGTGSEVTRFTIITDDDAGEKMLCVGAGFMPDAALIDYQLTLSLPSRVTADTGIDALTHAIEAYVSSKANAFSDSQALSAMRLIAPSLRRVYRDSDDTEARENMMLGSTLAGIAFSAASVALVHGMSRPIGANFHVPHGLSNAMLLPKVTEYSISGNIPKYADCARAMGLAESHISDDDACLMLIVELIQLNMALDVPTLSEFGVEKEAYLSLCPTMADQALASGSPSNNPRVPNRATLIELYQNIWA
ncbi:iron-containing alcohol dehydrogenase [Shewanella nanhaiensis]|uniref:Iron-containing alcohol dehydrogenase n=1 Tax=Shewanella nanhaiensis TaxID=2864872 RepID=A0ABS7E788_9GAMM|nr:iron-containing alcohol dehydrogenase [Shewanella nanhaiensis]MBW8185026.1 iron-containing alcohol dehydrogenase [Shewanella nanhaiensis]